MAKKKDFYGLTEDDYNEFRKYRASTENVQNLMSQAEKERHYLENDNLSIMERNRALYNHRITLNQLSEVSGAGVSVPGLNSGYMSQLQEQYTRALNRLDNDIKANRLDFGGLGMQTAAGFAPNGTQFDREPLSQHLKPGRGLIDFNTGYPTESNQRAAQENAMRTQYQNIQTEAGQESARWGQQAAADMGELEQTTYWLDILRGLPKSQDPGIVKNNNDLVAQIAAEAGIANYADADDLSAQLSVRESQLRAKSYWSERMADRSEGRQRSAMAYEYKLDNPNESVEANYYLALRDQAARDIQNVDGFADYFDTKGAVGDWLRYNSAYGDQLYQDQKNEEILAIRSDPNVGPVYQAAMEASRGAGEVANLRAQAHGEMRETGRISAQTEAAIRELAARYGITVGQGDAALEAALEQMHQQNSHNVNVSMARLQAQGYDPNRLRQYIQQALNEERMDAQNAEAREYADEHPVAATLGSSLTNVLSGGGYIASAPQAIGNAISGITGNYDNYVPIDVNSVGFDQAQYVMAVRDEVTKNIQENGGTGFLYGVGTSMLDNVVQMAVGAALMGGAGAVTGQGARAAIQSGMQSAATASLATMGLSAASQELVRLTEQGVSSDQAFALATVKGAVEIVTEKIGIDNFVANLGKKSTGNFVQQLVGMAAQQSAAEGGEEIIAEVAGLYADWLVLQEESDIAKTIEAGRLNGMTESEALWDAFEKYALQVLEAGAAGAVSGLGFGAMSTAGMVADAVSPAATGARIRAEGNEPVLGMMASAYGLEYDESMTDRQIGKVYREVQKQADRVVKDMQYGISMESYAQEKGYDTKTAKALSRSWNAYRSVNGNNMSSREFAATWNSVKAAGQANMSFDNAVAELGETTLSRYTLESAWKAGQRLYAQAQKTAKAQPVKPQETVQQENVPEVKLDTEIGEGVPAQTELVQRTSEKAATYAQQLMGERINVNGLSDDVVESFYDEIDSDIATERQGALAMARMLAGVSKNISQVIFVDSASYDAEGHVRLMDNGMWDPTNRTMTIDINAGRMNVEQQRTFMIRAMSHEITHSIKTTAREQYDELSRFVLREMDKQHNLEALIEAKIKDYASAGVELDREGAIDELVAEACEQMLERTDVLNKLAQENRSLWEKIRDFFKTAIEKLRNLYKGMSPNSTEAKMMQGVINELQAKWDAAFAASLTAETTETSAAAQHSIAGRNAAIADIVSMENAVRMEEAGHTAPEIYNDTGWFRGADDMWRFEIDDSTMRYTPERMAQKMTDGAAHLEDVIDHPVLFEAYPQLRDVSVTFSPMKPGSQGVYRRTENRIYLADSIKNSPEATLIHEIQHAIQAMEGFAFGASRAYWKKIIDNGGKIDSKRLRDATAAVRKFEGRQGNKEIVDARNRLNSAWEEGARAGAAMYAQLETEGIAEKVDAYEDMLWEQSNAGVAFLNSTPMELYENTAGEQEARDVAERRTMTSEQRKGKMPQTGTKDTVFTEGSSASASEESNPKAQYQISRDTASNMDLLMGASMDGLSKAEADHLLRYRDRVNEIRQNQRKIDELKAEELTADINAQIKRLENANSIIYRKVNATEQTDLMQRIIERERAAGDIEVQRMDNRVADLEDEIDELEQKIRNAKLAGQMGQGRRDAATLRKTEERLTERNEDQKRRAAEKLSKQKQKTEEQKQKYTEAKQEHRDAVAEYKQKLKAKQNELNRVREKRDERISQMQESRIKSVDSRHRTQMRHKIRKVVKELDSLLLRGTKDRNIRDEMKAAVASALEAVNMEPTDYEGRIAKLKKALAEETDPKKEAQLSKSLYRVLDQQASMSATMDEMRNAYAKYSQDTSGAYNSSYDGVSLYDEVVRRYIDAMYEKVMDTPIWEMNMEQLEAVYNMYKMILTDIQQANKLVRDGKNRTIYSMGNSVIRELDDKKRKELSLEIVEKLKQFGWDNLKSIFAMEAIGSNTLLELYENVRNGEDTWARDVAEAHKFYEDTAEKYNVGTWDLDETHRFASRSGKEFRLSLEQIMSLYAYSKRNQAEDHLQNGGFVFDSAIERYKTKDSEDGKKRRGVFKYRVQTKQAYAIDPLTLNDIIATLTDAQRNFVDEMQAYLSDTMGAKGNEVSLDMYGVRLFNEQNYFPLKTALQFLFEQNEVAGEVKLKNSGFSKHTKPHASNPVILSNFMDVWGRHVNDMSMYHAFVIPLENFNRVYNYQTLTTNEAEPDSVKGTLADIYGDAPVNYIKQMLTDLNGGARVDRTASVIDWGLSKFKSAAVMASASVVIQQISAVARATAYIDPQYFLSRNKMSHRDAWEELKAHAPVAIIKEMGRFDVNMGKATSDWITDKKQTGLRRAGEVADDFFSRAPAFMDEVGWLRIWAAVKKEAEKQTDLKPGTQEFLEHCGKRFTYIVERSQVYDSVLSRSATMRSKDTGMKMATAFMAEPITSMNMLVQAYSNFFRKGYRRAAARTVGAVAVSSILNSMLVSIVLAARDDDEDETYAEKYFQALSERLKGNAFDLALVNMVPFLRDIISIFQGYDVSRTDMSMVVDFYKAYQTIISDTASTYDKVKTVTGELARLFGLPVKNLWRDAEGIYNVVKGYLENEGLWTPGNAWGDIREGLYEGFTGKTISSGQKLYEAYMSGDGGKIFVLEAEYQDAYGEDWYKQIQSDLRTHVKGLYLDGDLSYDDAMLFLMRYAIELTPSEERQHDAGTISDEEYTKLLEDAAYWTIKGWGANAEDSDASTAKYADLQAVIEAGGDGTAAIEELLEHGETEKEIRSGASGIIADLYKNGEIDADTAEAYLAEYAGITDSKDLYTWFTEKDHWVETGENDYGAYGPVWDALMDGGDVNGAIDALVDAGWTEAAIADNIRTKTKEWVLGTASDGYVIGTDEARDILSKYGGVDSDELDLYIDWYTFQMNNPDYASEFSMEAVQKYNEFGTGIDLDVYAEFMEETGSMEADINPTTGKAISGSKKAKVMDYINAMPISDSQKDQLYYAAGYKQSTIYEAPWH